MKLEALQEKKARLEKELAEVTAELAQPKVGRVYNDGLGKLLVTYVGAYYYDVVRRNGVTGSVRKDYAEQWFKLTDVTAEEFIKELVK